MSKYKDIFLPTTNALNEVNQTTVFIAMLVIVGASIIYIMFGVKQLKLIFKHRDHSFKQNSYIITKILIMMFLIYIMYEIAVIILSVSNL